MAKESEVSHNDQEHKSHRTRKAGASAKKKSKSKPNNEGLSKEQKKLNNPKVLVRELCAVLLPCTLMNCYLLFDGCILISVDY